MLLASILYLFVVFWFDLFPAAALLFSGETDKNESKTVDCDPAAESGLNLLKNVILQPSAVAPAYQDAKHTHTHTHSLSI